MRRHCRQKPLGSTQSRLGTIASTSRTLAFHPSAADQRWTRPRPSNQMPSLYADQNEQNRTRNISELTIPIDQSQELTRCTCDDAGICQRLPCGSDRDDAFKRVSTRCARRKDHDLPRKRIAQWPRAMASKPSVMYRLRDQIAILIGSACQRYHFGKTNVTTHDLSISKAEEVPMAMLPSNYERKLGGATSTKY